VNEEEQLVARLGPGNFFGELALIRGEPRDTSAQSEGPSRVSCLSAEHFLSLYGGSLEMRAQLQRLSGFCNLAGKGVVTLHSGRFLDMDSITAMYHFGDGLELTSTKVVGKPIFSMRRLRKLKKPEESWIFERVEEGVYRQIILQQGRIVVLTSVGHWPDLGRVAESISRHRYIWPWQLALFQQQGELWLEREQESFADTAIICRCTGVTRGELNDAVTKGCDTVEKLAGRTGASRVCGSCAALLAEIVGRSDMNAAELIGIIPVTPLVKSFRFKPRDVPVKSSLPGQHIRIEGLVDGRWVQRSYTLTSSSEQRDLYEITVKREAHGLFSRWLHDRITTACAVRISEPLGSFYVPTEASEPVVYFAGGIGMTPALAMVRSLKRLARLPAFHVDYSAPTADQFAYADELTNAAQDDDRLQVSLRATEQQGRLEQADIDRVLQRYPNATYYVCGPKPFEQSVRHHLSVRGITDGGIRIEHFTPPGGGKTAISSLKGANALLSGSGLVLLLVAIFAVMGPIDYQTSVQTTPNFEFLWTENSWKQLGGYTAAGIMLAGMAMSLRKRWRRLKWGHFAWWVLAHALGGVLVLVLLLLHTGLGLGQALNQGFLSVVLATLSTGALVGMFTVLENRRPHALSHRIKTALKRLHIMFAWPIPALLVIHLVSVYYF
jgi:ferredoxin-NADP reductase